MMISPVEPTTYIISLMSILLVTAVTSITTYEYYRPREPIEALISGIFLLTYAAIGAYLLAPLGWRNVTILCATTAVFIIIYRHVIYYRRRRKTDLSVHDLLSSIEEAIAENGSAKR